MKLRCKICGGLIVGMTLVSNPVSDSLKSIICRCDVDVPHNVEHVAISDWSIIGVTYSTISASVMSASTAGVIKLVGE